MSSIDNTLIQADAHLRMRYESNSGDNAWREVRVVSDGIVQHSRYKRGEIFVAVHNDVKKVFYVNKIIELQPGAPESEGEPSDDDDFDDEDPRITASIELVLMLHEKLKPIIPLGQQHPIMRAIETFDEAAQQWRRGVKRAAPSEGD